MPIPTEVEKNETVEIRCNLVSEGNYQEAKYTIRYFQNQGVGNLAFANQKPFEPNDTYQMQKVSFEFDVKEE